MKKSLLSIILAVTLVFSGQTMVFAESEKQTEKEGQTEKKGLGDFLKSLFTEDGALSGLIQEGGVVDELLQDEHVAKLLPEGIDAEALVGTLREQLGDGNSELYQAADKLYDYVTNEDGSLNEEALMELASGLFAGKGQNDDSASGEEMMQQMAAMQDAVKELNADVMVAGDAQSVIFMASPTVAREDGSYMVLGFFPQNNYVLDGKDLYVVDSASTTLLFTLAKDDDGVWQVTDTEIAEEGDGYTEALTALCEEIDYTTDDFYALLAFPAIYEYSAMMSVLQEVPEAERIEYNGELLTGEEVKQNFDDLINEMMAQMGGGASEAATEDSDHAALEAATEASDNAASETAS